MSNALAPPLEETPNFLQQPCLAFEGCDFIVAGPLKEVAVETKQMIDAREEAGHCVLVFAKDTSDIIEIDFRGTWEEFHERLLRMERAAGPVPAEGPRGPGRPKLGVIAREVTLLPRHWEWLATQPGGASVALRKLVEEARRTHRAADRARRSHEAVYRFLSAVAGDLPGYEEALRHFYNGDWDEMAESMHTWPAPIVDHVRDLIDAAVRDAVAAGAAC